MSAVKIYICEANFLAVLHLVGLYFILELLDPQFQIKRNCALVYNDGRSAKI